MTENKLLWHYCSLDTFFNIIKYQSIRLSDVYKSNDYLEKEGFQKLIRETIMEEYFSDKIEMCENFQDFLCCNFLNSNNDLLNNYCFCLTDKVDSQLHWQYYADSGKGVALGFEALSLMFNEGSDVELVKMNYNQQNLKEKIKDIIESIHLLFETNSDTNEMSPEVMVKLYELKDLRKTYKSMAFCDESEYRLIIQGEEHKKLFTYNRQKIKNQNQSIEYELFPVDYMCAGDVIKSFYTLSFKNYFKQYDGNKDFLVKKIILGPRCKESKDEIERFISDQLVISNIDYKACLEESKIINKLMRQIFPKAMCSKQSSNDVVFSKRRVPLKIEITKSKLSLS